MRYFSQLQTAVQLTEAYSGDVPFADFLKNFFRQHKKYGSRDRKQIAQLCYAAFRTTHAFTALSTEDKIVAGLFLCSQAPNELLQHLRPAWNERTTLTPQEKCAHIGSSCSMSRLFPWKNELSEGMDADAFALSFLVQPDLFLRLRPGYEKVVKEKLTQAKLPFRVVNEQCLALSNTSGANAAIALDQEAVIQDYNSQRTGEMLRLFQQYHQGPAKVWDCCAGGGGKSMLAADILSSVELTVSDIRKSVLQNLTQRFAAAGIRNYKSFSADLSGGAGIPNEYYDLVIADVPCTGSGTWSRTPERLSFFTASEIDRYSALQLKIAGNAVSRLRKGGALLYITCSVFRKENEGVVEQLCRQYNLNLQHMELLQGYSLKADTLFAAILTA